MNRRTSRSASSVLPHAALGALGLLGVAAASPAQAADTHDLVKADAKAPVGQTGVASVAITGKNGWHVNEEAPITLKLTPPPGVNTPKPKLTRADLAETTPTKARFDVPLTGTEPGQKTVAAEASFVMCQATACQPVKETITLALDIVAPAASPRATEGKAVTSKKKAR